MRPNKKKTDKIRGFSLLFLLMITTPLMVSGQGFEEWSKDIGGDDTEHFKAIKETLDGGFILVGYVESWTTDDRAVYLVKTDAHGEVEWTKKYGDTKDDEGFDVLQTNDGGYLVTGFTKSYGAGLADLWLIKTDASGEIVWEQVLGGSKNDEGNALHVLENGEYLVVGSTSSYGSGSNDAWLIKTSEEGELLWNITLGGPNFDSGRDIISASDSGYLIVGETSSYGYGWNDFWLVKLDQDGAILWNKTYGGSMNDLGKSISSTDDGYILAGTSESFGNNLIEGYVVKVDQEGEVLWEETYGGASDDYLESIIEFSDMGYICVGHTMSTGTGESDVWLFSISATGELIDESFYGGPLRDRMYKVIPTSDEGYILTGFTWSFGTSGNGYLIKITMEEPEQEPETEPEPEPEPEPEQEPETEASGGIPGFPLIAVGVGLIASSLIIYRRQLPLFF